MSQTAFDGRIAYASYIPLVDASYDLGSLSLRFKSIFATGELVFGGATLLDGDENVNNTPVQLIVSNANAVSDQLTLLQNGANTTPARLNFLKTRSGTGLTNANTVVVTSDSIFEIAGWEADGANYRKVASIAAVADGSPSPGSSSPGRLEFYTTPASSITPVLRAVICNGGQFFVSNALTSVHANITTHSGTGGPYIFAATSTGSDTLAVCEYGGNSTAPQIRGYKTRSASGTDAGTAVITNDGVLNLAGSGASGTGYQICGELRLKIDAGTISNSSMPGRWECYTTPSGSTTPTLRWVTTNDGTTIHGLAITALDATDIVAALGVFKLAVVANNNTAESMIFVGNGAVAAGPTVRFLKTRTTGTGTDANAAVSSGDYMINMVGMLADGATYRVAGSIALRADGAPTTGTSSPGRWEFYTTTSGSTSQSLKWTITNSGNFTSDGTDGGNIVLQKASSAINYNAASGTFAVGTSTATDFQLYTTNLARYTILSGGDFSGDATNGGDIVFNRVGKGLKIKEGANARMGVATLVGGTVTVANTSVTANTRIQYSVSAAGGTQGFLSSTQIAATSFTITSTSGSETSTIVWELIEPA